MFILNKSGMLASKKALAAGNMGTKPFVSPKVRKSTLPE
jgi:hypothetical protein